MAKLVVACVQQQMRLFDTLDEYRSDLNRFLHLARVKGARLVVFPALAGVMAAVPTLEGFGMGLLRRADQRRAQRTIWSRTRGALAGSTANLFKVNFRRGLSEFLAADAGAAAAAYEAIFSELAQAYGMVIVAGSAYLPADDGLLRNQAVVFGPMGEVLGRHDKLLLSADDEGLARPGAGWQAIDTPLGRLGILFGEEALYPETGRLLAYQGADLLVVLAAVPGEALAARVRQAAQARAQDNQVFALASFLVGKDHLAPAAGSGPGPDLLGKSGIYAPLEMTPRFTGVLVEMGTAGTEGLLTAELDWAELAELRARGPEPVRRRMPTDVFAATLPSLYSARQTLEIATSGAPGLPSTGPETSEVLGLPAAPAEPGTEEETPGPEAAEPETGPDETPA